MVWRRPTTQPLNARGALLAGLCVAAAGFAGYLTQNPHPTLIGALEMAAASLGGALVVVGLAVRTNRQLRGASRRGRQDSDR